MNKVQTIEIDKKEYAIILKKYLDKKLKLIEDLEDGIAIPKAMKEGVRFRYFDEAVKDIEEKRKTQ